MIAFNRVIVRPIEYFDEYYEDEPTKLPVTGIVVDVPKFISKTNGPDDFTEAVKPGEKIWFSYLGERWGDYTLLEYDQIYAVERGRLIPLGDQTIVKFYEKERYGLIENQNTRSNKVKVIAAGKGSVGQKGDMYMPISGKKLEMENLHDHDGDHGYFLVSKTQAGVFD